MNYQLPEIFSEVFEEIETRNEQHITNATEFPTQLEPQDALIQGRVQLQISIQMFNSKGRVQICMMVQMQIWKWRILKIMNHIFNQNLKKSLLRLIRSMIKIPNH